MKKGNPIQVIALVLLLIVLPLGSWLYLKKGFNYQKEALAELKDYGQLPMFFAKDNFSRPLGTDQLKNKLTLINYFSNTPQSNDRLKTMLSLHEQFDDREGVVFLNIGLNPSAQLDSQIPLVDSNQFFVLNTSGEQPLFLGKEIGYPLFEGYTPGDSLSMNPVTPEDLKDYPFLVLIDIKGRIRNFYPYENKERIKRIVEHIALTMPRVIEPDAEVIMDEK